MTPDQSRWNLDIHRRLVRMECILNEMDEYQEPLTLLQRISRWWNRSHDRALEQQLSELRNKQIMDNTEALNKIGQVKANLAEAKAEIIAEINALKALVAGGASQADILAGLDELITESALLANVSPSLPTEPPTEPPAQG